MIHTSTMPTLHSHTINISHFSYFESKGVRDVLIPKLSQTWTGISNIACRVSCYNSDSRDCSLFIWGILDISLKARYCLRKMCVKITRIVDVLNSGTEAEFPYPWNSLNHSVKIKRIAFWIVCKKYQLFDGCA